MLALQAIREYKRLRTFGNLKEVAQSTCFVSKSVFIYLLFIGLRVFAMLVPFSDSRYVLHSGN